jgi:hypothetical protein
MTTEKLMLEFDANLDSLQSDLNRSQSAVQSFESSTLTSARNVENSFGGLNTSVNSVTAAMSRAGAVSDQTSNSFVDLGQDTSKLTRTFNYMEDAIEDVGGDLNAMGNAADTAGDKASTAGSKAQAGSKGFNSLSKNSGQASIQLQQFVGQIQTGTPFLTAFSQQAADLGIVLGAAGIGAFAGIAASIASFFIPSLTKGTESTQELIDKFNELIETGELTINQEKRLAQAKSESDKETQKQIDSNNKEIQSLEKRIAIGESLTRNIKNQKIKLNELADIDLQRLASLPGLKEELIKLKSETDGLTQSLTTNNEVNKDALKLENDLAKAAQFRAEVEKIKQDTLIVTPDADNPRIAAQLREEEELIAIQTAAFERELALLEERNQQLSQTEGAKSQAQIDALNENNAAIGVRQRGRIRKQDQQRERFSSALKLAQISQTLAAAKSLGEAAFEDNKLLNAGFIAADTYVGVQRALTPAFPGAPPNVAAATFIALAGALNVAKTLSASKGGGGVTAPSGGVSGNSTGLTTNNTTSGFDVPDQQITASINDVSGGGISTQRIIISTEDGQDLLDGISVGVQESQFNGRT